MTYTNIASPYMTGNWGPANYNFNKHSWTLFNQANPNFSKAQFKVALQQLQQAGVLDSSRGWANEKLKAEVLQGVPGIGSNLNPLGQFQGREGNLGLKYYNQAKAAGWKPQEIYDEISSGRSGMYMPEGAMNQYLEDTKEERDGYDFPTINLPGPAPLPGTQTGQANVGAGYNALGIRTPRPAGYDLNTGGTKKAFGRDKKNKDLAAAQLAINPLTL